ncbi:MAG TPA: hypothetical protein VF171_00025 [Trueperaceae bacterium]
MIRPGFEVNTDTALIDPDWDDFAEAHERRYGLAINYVKNLVEGQNYANKVMDLVVGAHGFYVQSKQFPAAFYGETADVTVEFVEEAEAQAAAWEAAAHYRAGEAQALTCVYTDTSPPNVFFGYRTSGCERYEMGRLQASLPLHFRVMLDTPEPSELLRASQGVVIYQRTLSGQHLLIRSPGRRQPFPVMDGFEA